MNTNTVASDPVVDGARERLYVAFHREIIAHCGPNQLIRDVDDGIDCKRIHNLINRNVSEGERE